MDTRFFDYCINQELFTREALQNAESLITDSTSIYEAIVHSGAVTQELLSLTAGEFYHLPVVDISQVTPEKNALRYGSPSLCRKLGFLPFAVDPAAGVLIAIIDATQCDSVRDYLAGQRVERMSFYIAPCDTLVRYIDTYFDPVGGERQRLLSLSDDARRRRNSSVMRTQYLSFDAAPSVNPNSSQPADADLLRQLQSLQKRYRAITEENISLHHQLDKLSRMIELEAQLSRELALALKSNGTLSGVEFDRILGTLK